MDREKKPLTAQEKIEMDLMAEAELAKLQRQYRIMEGDRKAFSEETRMKLAKQKRTISALQNEKENLLTELRVAMSESNKRKDLDATAVMNQLLDEHENCEVIIRKQKAHLNEVNKQIKKLEKRVFDLRAKEVTDSQFQAKVNAGDKMIQVLQNQLETEIKRFCSALTNNRTLREEIDHLLKERSHFNAVWEKLLANLNQGKKLMLDLIEQATVAYDQREEWGSKLRALRVRNQNDLMLHTQEMKELQRQLDHDHMLYDFLGVKGQKRILRDLEEKEMKKKEMQKEEMDRQLMRYQDMLKEIQDLVNEEDTNRLASQYFKQEEENFALFNYVNELNHEIEVISDGIVQLRIDIENQKELNAIRALQQKETVDTLTADLENATDEAKKTQEKLNETDKGLDALLNGVDGLFNMVHCDNTPILQLLGGDATINNYNAMVYLGILERQVGELTANMYLKEKAGAIKETKKKKRKRKKTNYRTFSLVSFSYIICLLFLVVLFLRLQRRYSNSLNSTNKEERRREEKRRRRLKKYEKKDEQGKEHK